MSKKADKDLLRTARVRYKQGKEFDSKQQDREKTALGFYAGDQWPDNILKARQGLTMNQNLPPVPARPTITINLVKEPVRQVLNQERQSDLGIELIPADDFGNLAQPINELEIQLREGLVRRIQRDSEANDARSWAFSRAVIAGRGYYGVMTRYAPGKTADQEVYIERFYDQNGVLLDPSHEQPDGSDANWAFTGTDSMPWEEYKALHPELADGAKNPIVQWGATDFGLLEPDEKDWFTFDADGKPTHVRLMNYYFASWEGKELAMFKDGQVAWKQELGADVPEDAYTTRRVATRSIEWIKTDGVHVIDRTEWPGHYIPIIKVIGEELQPYDRDRVCEGIVGPAMEPGRAANYMISKLVETIGLSPIPQWIMAAGQDEGFEDEWNNINTRTLGRLHYNTKDVDGQIAGPPQRVQTQSDVQAVAGAVQMFMDFVQKVMSSPDPSLGNVDPTIKSGKLAKMLIDRATMGNSNFMDNLARSMRHEARVINDLLYPIYGQRPGRLMRLMNGNKEQQSVLIGKPMIEQNGKPVPAQEGQPEAKTYTLTPDVEWTVAVKVGKNFDTRRQEEADIIGRLIEADPQLMAVFGDLFFKNQDGPGAKEMAERMEVMLAPPVQQMLQKGQGPQIPPEVQAQMAQMQAQMQEMAQLADKNKSDLAKTEMQQQAENERKAAELASKERIEAQRFDLERRKLEIELEIEMAKLGHAQSMARAEQEQDMLHRHADRAQEREMAGQAQGFEREQTVREQAHASETQNRDQDLQREMTAAQAEQAQADRDMQAMSQQTESGA